MADTLVIDDATQTLSNKTLDSDSNTITVEGTSIKSTGEVAGSKFLREDGDGSCSWQTISGGGDMLASTYDPTSVESDVFDMDNMIQGGTNKFLSSAELTVVQNTSGTNTGDQDLSGLVPYTGASSNTDLGSYNLTTTGNITASNLNISNWDAAYGWGDHSTEGYLTNITGENIGSLNDVTLTSVGDNELMAYDSTSGEWINQTKTEAGFSTVADTGSYNDLSDKPTDVTDMSLYDTDDLTEGTTNKYFFSHDNSQHTETYLTSITGESINDLSDVDTTGIENDKILKYNSTSSNWEIADDENTTYTSSDFNHDDLTGFVANEHIDWTNASSNFDTTGSLSINGTEIIGTDAEVNASVIEDKFLRNDGNDTTSGKITASNFEVTSDNATNDSEYVPMVLHGTDETPPTASNFPQGTIYIQYTE